MSDKIKHVSATSISAFKACPIRYRLGYVEALREAIEPTPFRFGTAWHKGLEMLSLPDGYVVGQIAPDGSGGTLITDENRLDLAVEAACEVYETIPDWADPTDWAVERETIANALAAYHWYHGSDSEYDTVATELEFDLPLVNPETGHPTPNFRRVGKIDRIIVSKRSGRLLIGENKSTSKSIDSGSTYWDRLRKDTQSKFYILAARDLPSMDASISLSGDPRVALGGVSGLLHDVFHKPQISPKLLTQADSKAFVEAGEYCGQEFEVGEVPLGGSDLDILTVDGVRAEREPGKKEGTFAIRETPGMFGARLLKDMTERPEYYFARREVAFTDDELLDFRYQIWALQRTMNEMERTGHWYENEQKCEATFRCAYCPICYNNVACFDGVTVPPGFKRLHAEDVEQTEAGGAE